MRMAAIYARVSSDQQREAHTIASQTASLIEFAKNHDLEVPNEWVFEDDGYSGATLERPGLERMRDLAAQGQIQVVLAYSPDRLSRKYAYQILLIEELARNGVETVFVKAPQGSSAEDQLLVQFQGMISEYERAQILGSIGLVRRLMARWSCSTMLFRYLAWRTTIRFSRAAFMASRAATFEPLLSIVTFSGAPFRSIACSKNLRAAPFSRCARSRKSTVSPALSTARYKYFHSPFTLM